MPTWPGNCYVDGMITTNLPQLFQELQVFGPVNVHDHLETIDLDIPASFPFDALDDLLCDALFVDPLYREMKGDRCLVHMSKRIALRSASDMVLIQGVNTTTYLLQKAA